MKYKTGVIMSKMLIVSLLFTLSINVSAQVEINVSGDKIRGIPAAIVPFKVVGGAEIEHEIDQIISYDLRASGKFDPIASNNFLTFPSKGEDVRFKDWRLINAEVLVIGEVWKIADDNYELQFRIFNVPHQKEIGTGSRIPNLRMADLRNAAHIISDHIYEAFVGRPGAFHSRIAYIKQVEVEYQRFRYKLMVADWDGYNPQEVYASWRPMLSPSWSPDGRNIAFVSFSKQGAVVRNLELVTGKNEVIASFKGVNSAPAWSPDGTQLAYSTSRHGSPDVHVYNIMTKQHQRINSHYGIDTEPAWSPDGGKLLFTSSRSGKPQIYSYDIAEDQTTRMTFDGKENANASYDFEGKKVVLVHDGGEIVVMDVQSGQLTWLTSAKFDESPSFSPNGDMVLYVTEQNYEPAIMVASSDGRVRTRLDLIKGDVREPAWSPLKK